MKSFRTRLAIFSALVSAIVIAIFGMAGWLLTKRLLLESVDFQLAVPLDRIHRELHPHANLERIRRNISIGYGKDIEEGKTLLLMRDYRRGGGDILYQGPSDGQWLEAMNRERWEKKPPTNPPPPRPPRYDEEEYPTHQPPPHPHDRGGKGPTPHDATMGPKVEYHFFETEEAKWRVGIVSARGFTVLMARNLEDYHAELAEILKMLLLAAPFCLAVIGIGGWIVGRQAMNPLTAITETAGRITASQLQDRIPVKRGEFVEFANLISVLNRMMDRLEKGFNHAMRFSADVSHELKTPITIMQGELNSALKKSSPGSEEEQVLQTISQECDRLKAITGSLMLLSQAESGRLEAHQETISLSDKISDLAEDAEILCDEAGLKLETNIEPDISIITDQTLLHQALLNLVSNAIKYNEPGGWVRMELTRHDIAGEATFRIANSGPGIPETETEQVFERFYRVDKARDRAVDGFGLGLNLSKEIISVLGGELELLKADQEETRFQVRLPSPGH